ncbi:hypothetical protein MDAP_002046 [Mitosporidium daphniae]|uniref:RING-CH-type domain-containing protein n=1 Tax=Mitosporidium daphniae TaxID=1485682 RepID=A0A098VQW8_9MICR|nr:uncharacterized protein DI09_36p80 [Mitosporidium daphniae]KGG51397.1 hypothetical protein DI09_36p80 [Mitosporidium daphniae]|eukprot:XP_013237841.1 uncharacterized protein DI09_36p80 [Mitosporidium daphniae]
MNSSASPYSDMKCRICYLSTHASCSSSPLQKEPTSKRSIACFFLGIIARLFRSFSLAVLKISVILKGSPVIPLDESFEIDENIEVQPGNELISPCSCIGSVKWVHRACINQWRYSQFSNLITKFSQSLIFDSSMLRNRNSLPMEEEEAVKSCLQWVGWAECLRLKRVVLESFSKFIPDVEYSSLKASAANWFALSPDSNIPSIAYFSSDSIVLLRDAILSIFGLDNLTEPLIDVDAVLRYFLLSTDSMDSSTPYQSHISGHSRNPVKRHPFLNCDLCRAPYTFAPTVCSATTTPEAPSCSVPSCSKKTKRSTRWSFFNYLGFFLSVIFVFSMISTLSKVASHFLPNASHHQTMHFVHVKTITYEHYLKDIFCCIEELVSLFLSEFTLDSSISYGNFYYGANLSTYISNESPSPKFHKIEPSNISANSLFAPIICSKNNSNHNERYFFGEDLFSGDKYCDETYSDTYGGDQDDFFIQSVLQLIVLLFRGLMLVVCGPPLVAFLLCRILTVVLPFASMALLLSLQGLSLLSLFFIAKDYQLSSVVLANMLISISFPTSNIFVIVVGLVTSIVGLTNLLYLLILISDSFGEVVVTSHKKNETDKRDNYLANRFYWNIQTQFSGSKENPPCEPIKSATGVALSL